MESTSADTILTPKRVTTFLASLLVALCSGTNYAYSVYAPQLGGRLQLSHAKQNLVGLSATFGVCGFGPFLGKLADTRGPRPSLALSSFLLLTGYLGIKAMYDASEGNTEPAGGQTFLALILFQLLTGIGSEAGYDGALNVVIKSFPDKIRTTATGIVISGFGLSAFLFSTLARTIFLGDTSGFLLTLALVTPASMVVGWFFIRVCPYPEQEEWVTTESGYDEESDALNPTPDETSRMIMSERVEPPNISGLAMVRTVDFWVLFWTVSLWINNLGLIARALALKDGANPDEQEHEKWQTLQVSTLSIASCSGRALIGILADFVKRKGMRRVRCISIVATCFIISQIAGLCVQNIGQLQYAVFLVGISYGSLFGLTPIIVLEWFGLAHVSENCGLVTLSLVIMGNIFSMIFGWIFDSHSTQGEHGLQCLEGTRCYSASLYVTTLACVGGLVLAIAAVKCDRKYR